MKKKNVAQSAHSGDVRDHVPDKKSRNDHLERLARTFFGSSSSQHVRTVDQLNTTIQVQTSGINLNNLKLMKICLRKISNPKISIMLQ